MKRVSSSLVPPIALYADKKYPLHRQLYDWFQRAIANGQLRPGQRVPSTRALASELNVSRVPVLNAFEQLQAEGYLQTFTGAGTCVADSIPQETIAAAGKTAEKRGNKVARSPQARGSRRISQNSARAKMSAPGQPWLTIPGAFRMHLPALDRFPIAIWSRLVARHARRPAKELLAYGDTMGYPPFRAAITAYLGTVRAVRSEPSQVMAIAGSQQGLELSARVLLDPGDAVWMEEPGYPGAHQAFAAAGARLIPVPVDSEGLDIEEGLRRCPQARAVYVTPSHQYPLGRTLSASRRLQLLNWASRSGAWIIEDDYDSEYRFGIRPIASLQGLDSDARVIYIGTFSKVLFPSLRLGYVVVPPDLIGAFTAVREATDIFSSTLYQAVLTDFIEEGHFGRHARRMRMLYMDRSRALVAAIQEELGEALEIVSAQAGMHLAGLLRPGVVDTAVSRRAAAKGISAMPLSVCCLKRPSRGGLVLGYGGADLEQLREGVRQLKIILEEESSTGARRR